MYNGFYYDYFSIKESIEETGDEEYLALFSFAFMDNINDAFYQEDLSTINLEKYLHGFCDEFALLLNKKYQYPIYASFNGNQLIHAYCKIDNFFIDIRGITDDQSLFNMEFENDLKTQTYLKVFDTYVNFYNYMKNVYKDYSIKNEDELILLEKDKWLDNYYAI